MSFQTSAFFPQRLYDQITEVRVTKPELLTTAADRRSKPEDLTYDGKLTQLVADQPGRRLTAAGSDPLAMGNRYEFLGRIVRVLGTEFDGLIATTDVIEELLILDQLTVAAGADGTASVVADIEVTVGLPSPTTGSANSTSSGTWPC